jgi:branched-chain amino acid transport system substrate-binding protein
MLTRIGAAVLGAGLLLAGGIAQAQETLKIGAIGTLSGSGTAWGLALQRGVQMAIDEVNAAGGLKIGDKTYKPVLVMLDDQSAAAGARTAADRLISLEKVKYIIGPINSAPVLGVVSATGPAHVMALTDGFAPNILKNDTKAPYNFRTWSTNVEFAPPMIKWLHETFPAVKKVALIGPNDATGQSALPLLADAYKANGIDTWVDSFDRGTQEFTPVLTRMIAQGVDAFDVDSNSPGDASLLVKQARQVGFKGQIWQVGGPSVDEIMAVAGPLAEGFVSFNVFDFSTPDGKRFADTYHKTWPGVINAQSPLWDNSAKVLFEAFRRAGSIDVDKVKTALEGLDGYDPGLIGPVVWSGMKDYGVKHQMLTPFWIVQVKDGQIVVRSKITPQPN